MTSNFWNMAGYGSKGFYDVWAGSWLGIFLLPIILWSLFWKGWALWKAARSGDSAWFIVLLAVNTVGILEIIYVFLVAKDSKKKSKNK